MKVGVLIDHWDPSRGGAERALAALVRRMRADGWDVLVLGLDAAPGAPGAFRAVDVGRRRRGDLERALADRSLALAAEEGCDVTLGIRHLPRVDVYWPHGGLHAATLAAGEASRGALGGGVARVLHRLSYRHRAFLDLEASLLGGEGARRVWCVSSLVRDEIAAAYPSCAHRLELHRNGVDRARFHPGLRTAHRDEVLRDVGLAGDEPLDLPVFLFLGGNWRLKGWRVLLRALSGITALDWRCVAAGERSAHVALAAESAGLARRFAVLSRRQSEPLYGAADVLVQPTWRDPCSLATLEALAAGVPVVTTAANGAAEAIDDPSAGAVIPAGDAAALAKALTDRIAAFQDGGLREQGRRAAREATEDRSADDWLDALLASLLDLAAAG